MVSIYGSVHTARRYSALSMLIMYNTRAKKCLVVAWKEVAGKHKTVDINRFFDDYSEVVDLKEDK